MIRWSSINLKMSEVSGHQITFQFKLGLTKDRVTVQDASGVATNSISFRLLFVKNDLPGEQIKSIHIDLFHSFLYNFLNSILNLGRAFWADMAHFKGPQPGLLQYFWI